MAVDTPWANLRQRLHFVYMGRLWGTWVERIPVLKRGWNGGYSPRTKQIPLGEKVSWTSRMEAQEDHSIVGLVKSLRPNQQMSQTVVASHVILSFIRFARSVLKCGWFIKGVNDCLLWFVVILYDVCCRIFSYWTWIYLKLFVSLLVVCVYEWGSMYCNLKK